MKISNFTQKGSDMKNFLSITALCLMISACGALAKTELQGSTEGSGSDALRKSPCACEYRELELGVTATAGFTWPQKNKANPLAWGRGYGNARKAFLENKDGYGQMREDAGSLYQRIKDVSRGVKR